MAKNLKYTVYNMKNAQTMMTSANTVDSINIRMLSANPRSPSASAASRDIFRCTPFPRLKNPTRFPTDRNTAFMMVTLFATINSASPSLQSIVSIFSSRISSFTSIDSEQKPMTKNKTTSDEPTATKIGFRSSMICHGPPSLNVSGDAIRSPNTTSTSEFQVSNTATKRSQITPPKLNKLICSPP